MYLNAIIEFRLLDFFDIFLVAYLLFVLYRLLKGTVAIKIVIGIVALFLIYIVVTALQMELLSKILGAFISVGFIALIIIFQPEIRRFLLALGTTTFFGKGRKRTGFFKLFSGNTAAAEELAIDPIIVSCQKMSDSKTGALIVLTRRNELDVFAETGERIDARISSQLLENIFFKNSPLHDGALIIHNNRLHSAGCILPVTPRRNLPKDLGLRHRAALGLTEQSDAIAVVVSEETGKISWCVNGRIKLRVNPGQLKELLEEEFRVNEPQEYSGFRKKLFFLRKQQEV
ncbi:MAG: diadenylate cyclase CdaA [Bacteroidales bacterium]